MNKHYIFMGLVASLFLTGCVGTQPIATSNKFNPVLTQFLYENHGKSTIKGSAYLRKDDGKIVTCKGLEVGMIPVTPYSSERIEHIYSSTEHGYRAFSKGIPQFNKTPDKYEQYVVKRVCDRQGHFTYENVGDGEYFITTSVQWQNGNEKEGGILMQKVKISNRETKKIVLTE
ncbi:MAG: hypothetical protein PHX13_03355 [Thiovulaceae bacterium]|nr:hypothetical protein [Sulfurimonadaceae bacterium]